MNKLEKLKKKILYRSSYRGTKEMDLLLGSFVRFYINEFNEKELLNLSNLLDIEDEILLNFYLNETPHNKLKENKITDLYKKFKL
jgi:antitoxin CptB